MANTIYLDCDSEPISHLCRADDRLRELISVIGPISYDLHNEQPFVFLIHEIIEQMLSTKAANKIFARLLSMCDGQITAEKLVGFRAEELKSIGTSWPKVSYIQNLSNEVLSGKLNFEELSSSSDEEVKNRLLKIKGIGNWTAKMYLIFVLDRQDILPYEDVAFLQAYKWLYNTEDVTQRSIIQRCKKWSPYASIAARYLYDALDSGYTKAPFQIKDSTS